MKTTWQNEPKQSTEIIQSEHKYVFSLCVCVCVCVHQGYRSQSTSTGWQWTSGSGIETLWNIHEEIYTCFQVTEAGILNRDAESTLCVCVMCVCVCVMCLCTCVGACTNSTASQLYLFRRSEGTKAAVNPPKSDVLWPGGTLWNSAALGAERLSPAHIELPSWLRSSRMENRSALAQLSRAWSWKRSLGGGLDHRGVQRSFPPWVSSIGLCEDEPDVEGVQEQGDEDDQPRVWGGRCRRGTGFTGFCCLICTYQVLGSRWWLLASKVRKSADHFLFIAGSDELDKLFCLLCKENFQGVVR